MIGQAPSSAGDYHLKEIVSEVVANTFGTLSPDGAVHALK
jgi:hypothetical protein